MSHQQAEQAVMYWFGVFLDARSVEERAFASLTGCSLNDKQQGGLCGWCCMWRNANEQAL